MEIKTKEITAFFESKYAKSSKKSGYFTELRLGTSFQDEQRIDGFLMDLHAVDNYEITIFEFKVSRSDFLHELKNPHKREAAIHLSNKFYFVTANNIVDDPDEIPEDCGWMVFKNGKVEILKEAPLRSKPENAPWSLFASVFRRCAIVQDQSNQKIETFKQALSSLTE